MPLTPEEQQELQQLNAIAEPVAPSGALSPEEQKELDALNATAGGQPPESKFSPSLEAEKANAVSLTEIRQIADRHGLSASELAKLVPFYGGKLLEEDAQTSGLDRAVGFLGESAGLGLPKFIEKKQQSDPKARAARDELISLVDSRKSGLQQAAEIGTGIAAGSLGLGIPGAIAAGAIESGVAGLASSKEGEELQSTAIGAGIGAVGGLALKGLGRLLFGKAAKESAERLASASDGLDIERKAAARAEREAPVSEARRTVIQSDVGEDFSKAKALLPDDSPAVQAINSKRVLEALDDSTTAKELKQQGIEGDDVRRYIAFKDVQQEAKEFAEYLSRKGEPIDSPSGFIQNKVKQEGQQFIDSEWKNFQLAKSAERELEGTVEAALPKDGFWSRMRDRIIDGRYAARFIDDRLGTSLERTLDSMARKNKEYTIVLAEKLKPLAKLSEEIQKVGVDREALYRALDTGSTAGLKKEEIPLFEGFKSLFADYKQTANDLGIPIQTVKGGSYVPHHIKDTAESILAMQEQFAALRKSGGIDVLGGNSVPSAEEIKALTPELQRQVKDILWGIEVITGQRPSTPQELTALARIAVNPGGYGERLSTVAGAALKREGEIPAFLRETDPVKLAKNWAQGTFRHAFFREGIADLNRARKMAISANDGNASSHLSNLIADLSGRRKGTLATAIDNSKIRWDVRMATAAKDSKSEMARSIYTSLRKFPDLLQSMQANIYPNLLGLSPRAVIVNLTQPFTTTMPEIGGAYGVGKVAKAMAKTVGDIGTIKETLKKEGHVGAQWTTELADLMEDSLRKGALYDIPKEAIRKWRNASMALYEQTEVWNRGVVRNTAIDIADDLIKGHPEALRVVKEMGSGYRRVIEDALRQKDAGAVKGLMVDYMLGKTVFNYDRISMSEFGRTMGPIFSVFTKWPTSIAGDVLHSYLRSDAKGKATAKLLVKYLGPLVTLATLDSMLNGMVESSDQAKSTKEALLGKSGLSSAAPIGSLSALVKGDVLAPPGLQTASDILLSVASADAEKAWKGVNNGIAAFVPGAGFFKFILDTLPIIGGAKEPRGGTYLNRILPETMEPDTAVREQNNSIRELLGRSSK